MHSVAGVLLDVNYVIKNEDSILSGV